MCRPLWNDCCVQTELLQLEAEQIPALLSPQKLNPYCQHLTRNRSCKTLNPSSMFLIKCTNSIHLNSISRSIFKCWVLSIKPKRSVADIILTTGIFSIKTLLGIDWAKVGSEMQQKCIQVLKSKSCT